MSKIPFTKMHGCGNDYIYVDASRYPIADPVTAAVKWSDRHKGIGSDGLVLIDKSPVPEADFSMRIFNADGSEAMMCGNASRCIGKYLYERGLTDSTKIRLLTLSGIKTLNLHVAQALPAVFPTPLSDGVSARPEQGEEGLGMRSVTSVTVDMGTPQLENPEQFVASRGLTLGTFVSMGNPHYVIFTDDVDQVVETGRALEYHPAFPQRCNIEFARIEADGGIRTRVWERGSGVTQACGTGACATAVAAFLTGRAGRESDIIMDGGTLHIEWCESDRPAEGHISQKNHVLMTGSATFVFDGEIDIPK